MSGDITKYRVLLAKPGLDGHDRGIRIVGKALRDAGIEIIYTGLHQTPEMIVNTALEEDVDMIGLSVLSGSQIQLFGKTSNLLKNKKALDILVVGGGIISEEDSDQLMSMGLSEIFLPGTALKEIVTKITELLKRNKNIEHYA